VIAAAPGTAETPRAHITNMAGLGACTRSWIAGQTIQSDFWMACRMSTGHWSRARLCRCRDPELQHGTHEMVPQYGWRGVCACSLLGPRPKIQGTMRVSGLSICFSLNRSCCLSPRSSPVVRDTNFRDGHH
jgi:hypothetical protein